MSDQKLGKPKRSPAFRKPIPKALVSHLGFDLEDLEPWVLNDEGRWVRFSEVYRIVRDHEEPK